jgi:hypothetical protein
MPMMRVDRKGAQDFGVDANNTSVKDGMFQTLRSSTASSLTKATYGYVTYRYVELLLDRMDIGRFFSFQFVNLHPLSRCFRY